MTKRSRRSFSVFFIGLVLALLFAVPSVTKIHADEGANKVSAKVNGAYVDDYESVTAALAALSGQYTTSDSYLFELNENVTESLSITDYDSITIDLKGNDYKIKGTFNVNNSGLTIKDSVKTSSNLVVSLIDYSSSIANGSTVNILTSSVSFEEDGNTNLYFNIVGSSVVKVSGSLFVELGVLDIYDGSKLFVGKDVKVQRPDNAFTQLSVGEEGTSWEIGGDLLCISAAEVYVGEKAHFSVNNVTGKVAIALYNEAVALVNGNITSTMQNTIIDIRMGSQITVKGNVVAMELNAQYDNGFWPSVILSYGGNVLIEGSITTSGIGIYQAHRSMIEVLKDVNAGTIAVVSGKRIVVNVEQDNFSQENSLTMLGTNNKTVVKGKTSSLPIDIHPDSSITTIQGNVNSAKLAEMFSYGVVVVNGTVTTSDETNFITFHDDDYGARVIQHRNEGVLNGGYFVHLNEAISRHSYALIKNASKDVPTGINSNVTFWFGLAVTTTILLALNSNRKKTS